MSKLLQNCPVLQEIVNTGTALSASGTVQQMHSNIMLQEAETLYETVLSNRPSVVVEIGMAFGISSLAILTALDKNSNGGRLISIDPNQSTQWKGCGITSVERAGLKERHQLIEEFDYTALPRLLGSNQSIDFAFIDGWHTFDYTLLDFWYLDKMLTVGGVIAFDDCQLIAVSKVIQFVLSHRKYEELDTGLPVPNENYAGLNGGIKRLLGRRGSNWARGLTGRQPRAYSQRNRYIKKTQAWEPDWDFFANF